MPTPVIPLADGFSPADQSDWLALVAKTLKGAGAETLVLETFDGRTVEPLYTAANSAAPAVFTPPPRGGDRSWDVRALVSAATPGEANKEALDALAGGAASVLVRLDAGQAAGVAVAGPEDMGRLLDGVDTDVAPVALDAGLLGPLAAQWLGTAVKASPAAPLALNLDPLSALAIGGSSPGPIEAHVTAAAAVAARMAETHPKAGLFLASGIAVHEAGGSPAWEIGVAAAAAVAYAKALTGAGLDMAEAFARLSLGVAVDATPLAAIAKLRAARVVWTRITAACGVDVPARIEARSSRRMLTRADRWTNLIRLTSAGFAAAVGGADAIVLGAFTDAIDRPDAFALRMARNTQLVLMDEAHLGRVADPAAGSWALETQTAQLSQAAWEAFVAIEEAGGLAPALQRGLIAKAVDESREAINAALASRALRIIGVTDFKSDEAAPDAKPSGPSRKDLLERARQPGADSACPPLSPIRLEEMAQ